jgi:hypothetical protein
MTVKITGRIKDNIDREIDKKYRKIDREQSLLSYILNCFFVSAERHNLDNKIVNKVVRETQYLFKKDPKQRDKRCFTCDDD